MPTCALLRPWRRPWRLAGPSCRWDWSMGGSRRRSGTRSCVGSAAGEVKVLVATTVIEVGIDVPNATIMLIEHPERFGLAQLHQLRGRIGRGAEESYCILLAEGGAPDRLHGFAATQDGFKIAELDLAERGMGDLIGARQSGGFEVRHAQLPADADLLAQARELAMKIIAADPALQRRENQRLRERAVARYPRAVELFRVG